MGRKQQQQEQACRDSFPAEGDCSLPEPEVLDDGDRARLGEEAGAFLASPEYGYLAGLLDRQITARKLELLALPAGAAERFFVLKVEIALLEQIRAMPRMETYAGKRAADRLLKAEKYGA